MLGGSIKMRWKIALAALLPLGGLLATPALAQSNTASATTNGSTTIAAPITLTENSPLQFGVVVRPTSNSNIVTLGTSSCAPALTGSGNAALLNSTSGCATYTTGGEDGLAFDITTDSSFDMTRSGGTETITVTLAKSATSGVIGDTSADFKVGGSFTIDSTAVAGTYSGSFTTTVTYQ